MSDPVTLHNEQELLRLQNDIGEAFADKYRFVLVKMDIPVPMDPQRNIYKSVSYVVDQQTGIVTVGSDVPWSVQIEWGRDPGKAPPFEPIFEWVIKKLRHTAILSPEGLAEVKDVDKEARKIAWAVVQKIKNEGIEARYPLRISLEEFIRGL